MQLELDADRKAPHMALPTAHYAVFSIYPLTLTFHFYCWSHTLATPDPGWELPRVGRIQNENTGRTRAF